MKVRILSLLSVLIFLFCGCAEDKRNNEITLAENEAVFHFIDVGQGDCTLIQTNNAAILIDAGTGESGSDIYNYIDALGIEYIDCFIATHPHEDHLGGAFIVLSGIDVGKIYINGDTSNSYFYERFIDKAIQKNVDVEIADIDCIYKYGDVSLKFLSPSTDFEDTNNNSLVTMVNFGEVKALFMADAEGPAEKVIMQNYNLKADILKIGHHGSRNASTIGFLKEVNPALCVIQCGKDNSYGHPHKEALRRIEASGAALLRCDENGTIVLKTDGKKIFDENGKEFNKNVTPSDIAYIGNKKSKTLHMDYCPNLPGEANRIYFEKRELAVAAGYKLCGNCNP